ncbi:DUF2877 domain-containing protein [Nocardioides caricicola]|uniref:DUF2877 domain-containing protein n=1 Tax=Nocardioides caricicola TaxID=634770 RepID=A0ABW0N2W1_9ACTN
MIPVSAPARVREHLRAQPDGPVRVLHRGRDAVYVEVAGRCVGVVGPRATAVPCALRSRSDHLGGDSAPSGADAAYLRQGVLHLDGAALSIGRIVDVRVPRLPDTACSGTLQAVPPAAVTEHVGSVPSDLGPDDVARMVGRGDGLTPLGDDVICGWLAIHRAAGVETPDVDAAVRAHLGRTTLLSATLLDCAMHGEVIPEFAAWVAATDDPDRTAALAAVGHTSGAGMLHGARLALTHLQGVAA